MYAISMRLLSQNALKKRMDIAHLFFLFPRIIALTLACATVHAQTPGLDSARALLANRQFAQAEAALRSEREGPIRDTLLAQALVGVRDGQINQQRSAEALALLQRAASTGYPEASYPLATILASGGRIAEARQLLQPLAAQQDARALYLLGRISESVREYVNAAQFYERSAHQGNADALNNLGYMHANGIGVARDDLRAARYYRDALSAGSLEAGINLAVLIDAGRAALAPGESRERLLEPAAQVGQPVALRMLGRTAPTQPAVANASPAPAPQAVAPQPLVSRPAATPLAAASPAPVAVAAAASQASPPPDAAPATQPPLTAAQAAEAYAQAIRLQRGDGVVRDLAKAAALLERAATAGLPDALRALADVYDYGLGVVSNPRKALELRKAAAGR